MVTGSTRISMTQISAWVFVVKGWFRDKDENHTCREGYQKKPRTHQESREDLEAKADSAQADHPSQCHPSKKTKNSKWLSTTSEAEATE